MKIVDADHIAVRAEPGPPQGAKSIMYFLFYLSNIYLGPAMGHVKIGLVLWHDKLKVSNKETSEKQQCYCSNAGESESDGVQGFMVGVGLRRMMKLRKVVRNRILL